MRKEVSCGAQRMKEILRYRVQSMKEILKHRAQKEVLTETGFLILTLNFQFVLRCLRLRGNQIRHLTFVHSIIICSRNSECVLIDSCVPTAGETPVNCFIIAIPGHSPQRVPTGGLAGQDEGVIDGDHSVVVSGNFWTPWGDCDWNKMQNKKKFFFFKNNICVFCVREKKSYEPP